MVKLQFSKLMLGVRFALPAQNLYKKSDPRARLRSRVLFAILEALFVSHQLFDIIWYDTPAWVVSTQTTVKEELY